MEEINERDINEILSIKEKISEEKSLIKSKEMNKCICEIEEDITPIESPAFPNKLSSLNDIISTRKAQLTKTPVILQ